MTSISVMTLITGSSLLLAVAPTAGGRGGLPPYTPPSRLRRSVGLAWARFSGVA